MLPPVTKKYADHSTQREFCFSFFCDRCGMEYKSECYPCSMANEDQTSADKQFAFALLWKNEHDAAYERANLEALMRFNKCPQCGDRVCDNCFSEMGTTCLRCESGQGQYSPTL